MDRSKLITKFSFMNLREKMMEWKLAGILHQEPRLSKVIWCNDVVKRT